MSSSRRDYPPRERTPPPRQFDRRASSTYTPLASNSSNSYRPANDQPQPQIDRPVPRGPRADSFRAATTFSSTFAPRGRGSGSASNFAPRPTDSWDRDRDRDRERDRERDRDRDRDVRNPPIVFRRDDDRSEWPRRDDRPPLFNRDRPPYPSRERSASPIRARRDSKESLGPTFGRPQDSAPPYFAANARGGASVRGRGRGDWDRSRGRTSFVTDRDRDRERDLFPNRSRSREGWRDRDRDFDRARPFVPDVDRTERFERREYDRPLERDSRNRDHDIWQRDPSPGRSSTGNRAASPGALSSISQDRPHKPEYDSSRKPLTSASASQSRDPRHADADYFTTRSESIRREPSFLQPPPVSTVPQSSSLGLDYGPPPSAPTNAPPQTPSAMEKPPQPPKPPKQELPTSGSQFQPPSGPKAERTPSAPLASQISPASTQQGDNRAKVEVTPHVQRQQSELFSNSTRDFPKPSSEQLHNRQPTAHPQADRPLPPNVPSGPRIASGPPFKPKTSPIAQQIPLPPHGPTPPKLSAMDARSVPNAPTGPRGASIQPPSGPRLPMGPAGAQRGQAPLTWPRPQIEYRPQKPSIMSTMNRPHMSERPLPGSGGTQSRQSPKMNVIQAGLLDKSPNVVKSSAMPSSTPQTDVGREAVAPTDIDMSAPVSEDDDIDDEPEEDDALDEDYYDNSEKQHQREMELLKAKKSPMLLQDPTVVSKLIRIQLLGMIAQGLVPDAIKAASAELKDVEMQDQPVEGLISPQETPGDSNSPALEHPKPRGRPLKDPPINPIPTPPIDELPFLTKELAGTLIYEEPNEDDIEEEAVIMSLRQRLEHEAWDQKGDLQEIYEFYRLKYPEWRYEIDNFERLRRDIHEPTPDPGSPGGQSSTSVPPSAERLTSRTARNATEFDMEKAILMSQQSAREEEERREREAASNAKPNYDSEAVVPDMLAPASRDSTWRFKDTTTMVPSLYMVELMQFIPPEDDFTEEEQRKFTTAFCQTPKKWGIIADHVATRSYHQCIAHYYLTKNEARYKDIWRRSQPKRKRGRAATKPRSTALLSDMALNEDPDSTPVPVTDSGRPRRAAAPTFGDIADAEGAIVPPAAKRLALGPKDPSDNPTPKATKGRKAGTATKVRRTKAQMLADSLALAAQASSDGSPHKVSGRARTLLRADGVGVKGEVTQLPANARLAEVDTHPHINVPMSTAVNTVRQRSPPAPVVTSYWSVPEGQKFRQLVAYYGHDYAKIAEFMKTKSQAMIKNHYTREVQKGNIDLERLAQVADEKITRGEPMGRPPSPIAPRERKYDSTPSIPTQARPLTASTENTAADTERAAAATKPVHVEDFPPNSLQRDANGSIVAKPSMRTEYLQTSALHTSTQPKIEDYRERPVLAQKAPPPRGHFTDEASSFPHNIPQRHMQTTSDHAPRHHPPNIVDLRGGDLPSTQMQSSPRDALLQVKDPVMNLKHGHHGSHYQPLSMEGASLSSRQLHSRHGSLNVAPPQDVEQAPDLVSLRNAEQARRLNLGGPTAQSPRVQSIQNTLAQRPEPYTAAAQSAPKQEAPKPLPAKRSNLFGLLNNDEPPERPAKRSSTDAAHRISINTPPQQPSQIGAIPQAYQQRPQEELLGRQTPGMYGSMKSQQGHGNPHDTRGAFSNSPAPSHTWLDKFDPRPANGADRASNQSPLYPTAPSVQQPIPKSGLHTANDSLRALEPNNGRRSHLGKVSSPPRQMSTPVLQYRSASVAPQQHSRMTSSGYAQGQPGSEHRSIQQSSLQTPQQQQQQQQQQQTQHVQQPVTLPVSTSGTPVASIHHRGQPSVDFSGRRTTIQEFMAQRNVGSIRDLQEMPEHRNREDALSRGANDPHSRRVPHLSASLQQEQSRQSDHRDYHRNESASHQVPPPPTRTSQASQMGHLAAFGGAPPRTYTATPPLASYGNDPRGLTTMHNQHAHHHHHNISAQGQVGQQNQTSQGPPQSHTIQQQAHHPHHQQQHHPHQQQQLGQLPPQGHQVGPHSHQQQASMQQQHQQQQQQHQQQQHQQQQPPPPPQQQHPHQRGYQGLAHNNHYRGYSQGGAERR